MIKINQIHTSEQMHRFSSSMDLAGICIGRPSTASAYSVKLENAVALRNQYRHIPLSVSIDGHETMSLDDIEMILDRVDATYFEYTLADFAKTKEFEAQTQKYSQIRRPRIVCGSFVLADDLGFISEHEGFEKLINSGVKYIQLELDSVVNPDFLIGSEDVKRIKEFCARFPVLVTDRFSRRDQFPSLGNLGFYFNLQHPRVEVNYDHSRHGWSEAGLLRLLKTPN